ncbi:MAG: anti-sigma factor domain-containing protein [Clostridium sp.]
MYKKAIVMEIKAAYAIAMEEGGGIIRIKKKDGLSVGDSIYVLPEDLYHQKNACAGFSGSGSKRTLVFLPSVQKSTLFKIASIAAMLILCITLVIPQLSVTTYAQASFDGAGSIQLSLDRSFQIIKAVSPDQSVPDSVLRALRGKRINDAKEDLYSACGSDSILVGYALTDENEDSSALASHLESLFPSQSVTFVTGTNQDIENAAKEELSLGKYLADQQDKTSSDKPEKEIEKENAEKSSSEEEELKEDRDSETLEPTEQEQDSETPETTEQEQDSETPETTEQEQDSETPETTEQEQDSEASETTEQEQDSETPETTEQEQDSETPEPTEQEQGSETPETTEQEQENDASSEEENANSEEEVEED